MASTKPISVDIVSDVMCPWCYIGQKNLEAAKAIATEIDVDVHWRPYQLDPTLPPEGKDRQTYLNEKFGGEEKAGQIYQRVKDAGSQSGIDFRFDLMKVSPNTLDAHRVIRWAGSVGSEIQDKLVKRLFQLFFEEGANVGDTDILLEAAKSVGMDTQIIKDLLASDKDKKEVQIDIHQAQQMGVTGVPFFILANKYALSGAQPPEVLANALRQISAEVAETAQYTGEDGNAEGPITN
ncbi:MAG: DsbA family oxidoreductase [Salaquimonas sp.]